MYVYTHTYINSQKVKELRTDLNLTRNEVSQRSGISSHHIYRIEHGITPAPDVDTASRLAKALDVDIHILLKESEE